MQLFCFTFAGGTAAFYNQIEKCISSDIKIEKLEYKGHGTRHKESFYHDFQELALDLYLQIKKRLVGDYALMGYSMGSISVTEVLRVILEKDELEKPRYVFMAAHEPYSKTYVLGKDETDVDEYVKKRTIRFGGVPEQLIDNTCFWRMYLPIYKADYLLIESYRFENLTLRTDVSAKIFYSEEDTPYVFMKDWSKYYIGKLDYVRYDGSHFFIEKHCKGICAEIEKSLEID